MGGSGGLEVWASGSETWIVCRRRLGSAWAGNVEADGGVGLGWLGPTTEAGRDVEHGVTERESD